MGAWGRQSAWAVGPVQIKVTRPHGNMGKTACIGSGGQTEGGMEESGPGRVGWSWVLPGVGELEVCILSWGRVV